jgi:hypothetical protein
MRSPGAVYRKLKEVKYRHLTILYRKYLRKVPENCRYNYRYEFMSDDQKREIRLCLLHQENIENMSGGINPQVVDVCEQMHHCSKCDGFVLRYTKEDVKKIFEEELADRPTRERKYPDVCALEWVLEKSVPGPLILVWPVALYFLIKKALFKNKLL